MPVDEQTIDKHLTQINLNAGDIQVAFGQVFDFLRKHRQQFERIWCQQIHLSSKGKNWDYIRIKHGIIITKKRLIKDLKHDIKHNYKDSIMNNMWLDGFTDKKDLLNLLSKTNSRYFVVRLNHKRKILSNISDVIGLDLILAIKYIDDMINRKDKMIHILNYLKDTIIVKNQRIYVQKSMLKIKKLSRGQTIMGCYFKHALENVKRKRLPLPDIITHAKAITFLKRHTPGKRQDLFRRNQIIKHINEIKASDIMYFVRIGKPKMVEHLTGRILVDYILIIEQYLDDKN